MLSTVACINHSFAVHYTGSRGRRMKIKYVCKHCGYQEKKRK